MAVLELDGIVKDYIGLRAVHGIDLKIDDGDFCVFVGPSGCGKSTLLRMIAGLEDITGGELRIDGVRVNDQRASERGLAMVFQTYALYPHMTVRENLAFGLENIRTPKDEIKERVGRAARMLQIEELLDRRPKQLSGGQRQRVAIGRAVVREPRVFLFDEPLSNLDAELRVAMRREISALHRRLGNTMIYVTHDQVEAMTMADRIVVLRAGRVEQYGTPLHLYNEPANQFVAGFIGSPRMNFIDAVVEGADATNVTVRDADGQTYQLAADGSELSDGQEVVVGIRPEHLEIGGDKGHPISVQSIEQLGGQSYLYCETKSGTQLTAHFVGQTAMRRGDEAHALFRRSFLYLFKKSDGQALRRLEIGEAARKG